VGPCRGYAGDCGDYATQFANVEGPYWYSDGPNDPPTQHMYLDEYVCHAFPDDAYITDQIFVGLISVAVALPVDLFLVSAFETANAVDIPCNWIEAPAGRWRFLLGKDAHNGWRLAEPRKPVSELVLWVVAGGAPTDLEQLIFVIGYFLRRLRAAIFGDPKPAAEEEESNGDGAASDAGSAAARADALKKRLYASAGLLGVYVTWAIMSWFIFTYGMLIYTQLGASAETEFTKVRAQAYWPKPACVSSASHTFAATDVGRGVRDEQLQRVARRVQNSREGCVADRGAGRASRDAQQRLVRGAHRFRQHAGRAVQRRRARLVGADALARAHAGAPDRGRLSMSERRVIAWLTQ